MDGWGCGWWGSCRTGWECGKSSGSGLFNTPHPPIPSPRSLSCPDPGRSQAWGGKPGTQLWAPPLPFPRGDPCGRCQSPMSSPPLHPSNFDLSEHKPPLRTPPGGRENTLSRLVKKSRFGDSWWSVAKLIRSSLPSPPPHFLFSKKQNIHTFLNPALLEVAWDGTSSDLAGTLVPQSSENDADSMKHKHTPAHPTSPQGHGSRFGFSSLEAISCERMLWTELPPLPKFMR